MFDPWHLNTPEAFSMTRGAGAQYVRLLVYWSLVAPANPSATFDPTNPTSPGYNWTGIDTRVEEAQAEGLTPILDITGTPSWAYAKAPSDGNGGSPQTAAIRDFAQALATHYDGEGVDAQDVIIPAVNIYEVWNEPNLSLDFGPVNAASYRSVVNAVADSVHAVDSQNLVVAGGLDPFAHKKSKKQKWYSVAPLAFMRSLLCLSKGAHPHTTCSNQIHFDVWSHHPYTFGGAFAKAKVTDDVELGDLPRMRNLLQAAVKLNRVVSDNPVQFWVSEFSWDTKPPRSGAAPVSLAARWTAESLYQAWRSGVSLFAWFGLEDQPGSSQYKNGLYFHAASLENARAKPVFTAFRFPFVAYLKKKSVTIWGRDATSTKVRVTLQLRHGKSGKWRTVAYDMANSNGIFRATVKLKATKKDWLRAVAPGSGKSLAFSLTVPKDPNIGPWGK